jgi:hypothetical protein
MMAASLGACAATIMSKAAITNGFSGARVVLSSSLTFTCLRCYAADDFAVGVTYTVDKIMQPSPRKIKRIDAHFTITGCSRQAAL